MIGLKRSIDIRILIATGDYRSVIALTFKDGSLKRTRTVKRKQTTKLLKYKKQAERYFDSFKVYKVVASMEQQKQMSNIIGDSSKRKTSNIQSNDKSHLDEIIPQSIQQQLLSNWNTPLPPAFFGAHISK